MAGSPLIACEQCATLHERTPLEAGAVASCSCCQAELYRQSRLGLDSWIALVATGVILFAIANYYPIARLVISGMQVDASLPGALWLTWQQGHQVVAIMTGLFSFWMPLTQLLVTLWALLAVRSGHLPGDFSLGMRLLHVASAWSMVPVLMLGIFVAMVKFSGLALISVGPAIWAFAGLAFLFTAMSRVSTHRIWHFAEDAGLVPVSALPAGTPAELAAACPSCGYVQAWAPDDPDEPASCSRCSARLYRRQPRMRARVWAFLIAAAIFYLPANLLPIMRIRALTEDSSHTILGGVLELWQLGSPDLAIIVFVASIVVPITKLMVLMLLMLRTRWEGRDMQRSRTRLYEFVNFIGHWSMLDVFVVILMSAMANFPGISQVIAGPAAASFGMVVILTMLAAHSYDPRMGWDRRPDVRHNACYRSAAQVCQKDKPASVGIPEQH
ncbi:paraquat-inducible protein A [Allopusillimonas ginsengisoli]|uniref:paraquat-inducible protein A n=1 Tax=Allopusillimonas ginsengisoli TaxID=453575 RepID=UPI00101EE624|nr:paraquat-inducible protein A [Allopusillimonas ginsengisoli]TEA78062.1 paraquat-inducible membrane protein A [Allopusillimonas ginsengisoli]